MLQRLHSSPDRLPPSPGQTPALGLALQDQLGNQALLERLMGPKADPAGDVGIQEFEPIGESDSETVWGGELGDRTDPYDDRYGRVAWDRDGSAKLEFGGFRDGDDEAFSGWAQAGHWVDRDGQHNIGIGGGLNGLKQGYELLGDGEDGEDFWLGWGWQLGGADARLAYEWNGMQELGFDGAFGTNGASAWFGGGSGHDDDSAWDTNLKLGAGVGGAGGSGHCRWSDRDDDGVDELNIALDAGVLGRLGFEFDSEIPGQIKNAWNELVYGGEA